MPYSTARKNSVSKYGKPWPEKRMAAVVLCQNESNGVTKWRTLWSRGCRSNHRKSGKTQTRAKERAMDVMPQEAVT